MILALFIVAAALSVFLIAALVVGREARRLDAVAPRAVYDLVEATEFVADLLPSSTQGRLTLDELREVDAAYAVVACSRFAARQSG